MPDAWSDGCRLWFEVEGAKDAPALLLANSIGTTLELWAPQSTPWRSAFRVVRYDARGHGRSQIAPGPYTLDQLGRDALAVLDAAGVDRAHVCGLSLGGLTAQWLALHAPARVNYLVLANTAARIGSRARWEDRIRQVRNGGMASIVDGVLRLWLTSDFRRRDPSATTACRAMLAGCPADGYLGCCAALRDADLRDRIGSVRAPVLVIVGRHDMAAPPADGEWLRDAIPEARLIELDAAHLSNVEQPGAFASAVLAFLQP
jgi:3-oxoadipate enol-lactonase